MKQSKAASLVEAIVNTAVGFCTTLVTLPLVNYVLGIDMSLGQASISTAFFTVVSIVRGYVIRRFFNNLQGVKSSLVETFTHGKERAQEA